MTIFKSIHLRNWRQFSSVFIEFHPRLTVITGANGAGKSTILNICSQHFGVQRTMVATPRRKKGGGIEYDLGYYQSSNYADFFSLNHDDEEDLDDDEDDEDQLDFLIPNIVSPHREPLVEINEFHQIGTITYDNDTQAIVGFPSHKVQSYGLQIHNQQNVAGVPISSHRVMPIYQPVQGLSLQLTSLTNAYQAFFNEYQARSQGSNTGFSPLYRMKETLIAMAAFGEGNNHLEGNAELLEAFNGFSAVLRKVLPRELGFRKLVVRLPDVVLKTRSGEFVIDSSSGGITAVIEIAWQLYLFSLTNQSFVATLDEPENHLHPTMQRAILSNLVEAFPQAQFIVATHSPFIVSAVEDSRVYALKYVGAVNQSGFPTKGPRRVRAIALDQTKKAASAEKILQEVLGVSVSIPGWAAKRLEIIVAEFENAEITPETLNRLRSKLKENGFSEYYPALISRLVRDK